MKTVVYLDVLLLVNFLIGFLMVGVVGLLAGPPPSFLRQVLSGCCGALVSLSILFPPLPWLCQILWQLGGCCLMILTAFGRGSHTGFLIRTGLLWAGNLLTAGAVILSCLNLNLPGVHTNNLQVYLYVSPQVLFWCSVGIYLAGWLWTKFWSGKQCDSLASLEVTVMDRTVRLKGLLDTGFHLRDDWSGKPVLLISLPLVADRIAPELVGALENWARGGEEHLPGLRLLPCATVTGQTLLPALPVKVRLEGKREICILGAFTREQLRAGEGVEALMGRDLAQALEMT